MMLMAIPSNSIDIKGTGSRIYFFQWVFLIQCQQISQYSVFNDLFFHQLFQIYQEELNSFPVYVTKINKKVVLSLIHI